MKKSALAIILSPLLATAEPTAFQAIIAFDESTMDLRVGKKVVVLSEWENEGDQFDCTEWTPSDTTIDYGFLFKQTQDCQQNQERETAIYDVLKSGAEVFEKYNTEKQTITVENTREVAGTKDFVSTERIGDWGEWVAISSFHTCDSWTPDPSTVFHGDTYTQTRNCSEDQERERIIYDVWASGLETENRREQEQQTVSVVDSQIQIGVKDYILSTSEGAWSNWVNKSGTGHYDCETWSPDVSTVDSGTVFEQTRDCKQDQTRQRDLYDHWKVAGKQLNSIETEEKTITVTETQNAIGTKNIITTTRTTSWSGWTDSGSHYNCGTFSPSVSTVNHSTSFTQTRYCSQNQTRTRTVYNVWTDGTETLNRVESDSQTITEQESRTVTGTKDYIVGTVTGSWSSWSNSGSKYNCGSYSPSTSTVNHGTSFTQTGSCSQNQTRSRTIYNDWKLGSNTYKSTETDSQVISVSSTRTATGTKDYIIGTNYGSWGSWSNYGSIYGCGSYSPSTSTYNHGTSFTQTASCSRDQRRSRTVYNDWKLGSDTYKSTDYEYRTVNATSSRSATGTKDYIIGTVYGSWSSWSNDGGVYNCGTYSPSTSTVNYGQSFTQTSSCTQKQKRTRTVYNDWKVGSNTYKSTETEYRTVSATSSRTATGTKNYVVGTVYGSWSSWTETSRTNCRVESRWNFEVTDHRRICDINESRSRSVYDDMYSGSNVYRETETETRTRSNVTVDTWLTHNCGMAGQVQCQ